MNVHSRILIFFNSICFLNYGIANLSEGCEGTRKFQCKLPFNSNGKMHYSCIQEGNEKRWCATEIDTTNSKLKAWGNCTESCSTKDAGCFYRIRHILSSIKPKCDD